MLNIKGLYLDNFRIFSEASHVRLAPITILTGPINSGKSTILKSLSMMRDMETDSLPFRIRFDSGRNPFGCFNLIRNNKNGSRKVTLGYDLYNVLLGEDIHVEFVLEKDGEFDAVTRNITVRCSTTTLFDFKFEKERIVVQTNLGYMLEKLRDIKKIKPVYLEIEKNFRNIRSESGSYKNQVSEKKLEKDDSSIRIFHVDNDIKRKNVLDYLSQHDITLAEYERLHYLFGKHRHSQSGKNNEDSFLSGIRKIIQEFDENDILINNDLLKRISKIPREQMNESRLMSLIKNEFPDLHDCLMLLNNPDMFTRASDLLRQKSYEEWEKEFTEDEITTAQRITAQLPVRKLSDTIGQHVRILFGESALFMALTDLSASRDGFARVYDEYTNLKSLTSFCEIVLDKIIHDLKYDLETILPLNGRDHSRGMNVDFANPMHDLIKKHSQTREENRFLKKWMNNFDLGDDIFFETPVKGMGYFPGIKKNHESSPLSEEGAGAHNLLMLLMEIAGSRQKNELHDFNDEPRSYPRTIMPEEPEIMLHPAWQSKLADMFADAMKEFGCHILLETCSENLVRKLQYLAATGVIDNKDIVIYYLDSAKGGNTTGNLREIQVNTDGSLSADFGPGFFHEEDVEMMKLRKINRN